MSVRQYRRQGYNRALLLRLVVDQSRVLDLQELDDLRPVEPDA